MKEAVSKHTQKQTTRQSAEPKIVTFMCHWCGYAAADLAGVSRMQYSSSIRVIRTMCTGRFDPSFILTAFERGADGVLICGCHPGDCQYVEGNTKAEKKIKQTRALLDTLGINPERLRLEWVSASEAPKFISVVNDFVEFIRKEKAKENDRGQGA